MMTRLKLLAGLIFAAVVAIVMIQVSWIKSSYQISREKIISDAGRLMDEAMLEHQELVATKVRGLLKRTIRPQDIETALYYQVANSKEVDLHFRTKRRERGSWSEIKVMRKDLATIQANPYPRLLAEIDARDLMRLESIYRSFVGSVTYVPYSLEDRRQDSLSRCFDLRQDTGTLKNILQKKLRQSNLELEIQLSYFERIYDAYSPRPTKTTEVRGGQVVEVTLDEFRFRTLTTHLDSLNAHIRRLNEDGRFGYVIKLNMDNVDAIIRDDVPVLMLKIAMPTMTVIKQMVLGLVGSTLLLLLLCFCLGYMFYLILKQKKLAVMKDDFMANVSHELKTPVATTLAAIQGMQYFDVLENSEKTKQYLTTAANEMQRLNVLIDAILNSALLEQPGFQLNFTTFNFKQSLESLKVIQERYANKNVRIKLHYKASEMLTADKSHLYHVMVNLVDNAIKYGKDEVSVEISVEPQAEGLVILVADNGIGIPVKYQAHVFDRFFRVPSPNDHRIKGYGLGLSYVKKIIEKHGGTIVLHQSDATGSTFKIELPQ